MKQRIRRWGGMLVSLLCVWLMLTGSAAAQTMKEQEAGFVGWRQAQGGAGVRILCYHDVGAANTPYHIRPETLRAHFDYLRDNGYTPLSLEQYIAACRNGGPLPPKPVMLTFDDGYVSFYQTVFPLLKEYRYPAMLAVVTSWLDYAPEPVGKIVDWRQLREMEQSGLVALASHSHQSHRAGMMDPYGSTGKLLEIRQYREGTYESPEAYEWRVRADLRQAQAAFQKGLGHPVRALVWPYGAYTRQAVSLGREEGFEAFFGLEGGYNQPGPETLSHSWRGLVLGDLSVKKLDRFLRAGGDEFRAMNASQLDIDLIYDADRRQMESNLNAALERLTAAGVNTVFLQAFSDLKGDGNVSGVYFPTAHAPVRADVFNWVAAQLRERDMRVFAWMPTLAGQWLLQDRPEDLVVTQPAGKGGWYRRATPFSAVTEQKLSALFADLAAYTYVDGILFQDDLYMNDFEDFSPAAQAAFLAATGKTLNPDVLRDPEIRRRWSRMKTEALTLLTQRLSAVVRQYRPYAKIARNIYSAPVLTPEAEEWFGQDYRQYLKTYDYTVIMAYPYMERERANPEAWLRRLAAVTLTDRADAYKTVFKLQPYDWERKCWLTAGELDRQRAALRQAGAVNLAYYPENVYSD